MCVCVGGGAWPGQRADSKYCTFVLKKMVKQIERETGCIKTSGSRFYQSVSNMFLVYDREGHSRFMYSVLAVGQKSLPGATLSFLTFVSVPNTH